MTIKCNFQIARLRSELDVVRGNIKVMSEMLTEMVPGHEEASDLELLQVRVTCNLTFLFPLRIPLQGLLCQGVSALKRSSHFQPQGGVVCRVFSVNIY